MGKKSDSKGKKEKKKTISTKKSSYFSVESGSVKKERKSCPKCGPGVFMAQHKNRSHCGKCGFAEFKQG